MRMCFGDNPERDPHEGGRRMLISPCGEFLAREKIWGVHSETRYGLLAPENGFIDMFTEYTESAFLRNRNNQV